MPIKELLDAIRTAGEEPSLSADALYRVARVDQLMQSMDESLAGGLHGQTWRDLAEADVAAGRS